MINKLQYVLRTSLALLFLGSLASAAPLTIVDNGQPLAAIVVVTNETKAVAAAKSLQTYIEKMSGAKLPIVTEGEPVKAAVSILVGHTAAAQKLGVPVPAGFNPAIRPEAFEEEGFVLKTVGNSIIVGGNSDGPYTGTRFAANALLEKLGCRWYFPGEWGEIVPKTATVIVPDLDVTSRPDFAVRSVWLSGWVETSLEERKIYADWAIKMAFTPSMYPSVGDGYLGLLLPPSENVEKHPEYYAMNKQGIRSTTPKSNAQMTMLCLSNPDVLAASISNVRAAFAGQRKLVNVSANGVGISPPDGAPFCYCDKCLAGSQDFNYPTYVQERMQSEEFFGFASKLAREFPDKYVATMSYALREMPPQGLKLPPNVAVTYAPITDCILHNDEDKTCWRRQEFVEILKQWRQQTPHLMIYDYNPGFLTGSFVPEREVANLAVNVPGYKQIGIKGMTREGRKAFMQTWLSYYVTAKLLWDSKADVAAIKKDFYDTFFGPEAGPHVQAWWDACEDALGKATCHVHEDWLVNHIYTVEFTQAIHAHVEAAHQAKMTDAQRAHFDAFALIADYLENFAAMEQGSRDLEYTKAAAAATRMCEDQEKLNKIYSFFITPDKSRTPRTYFVQGRQVKFKQLAEMTGGTNGTLVAPLPLEMKFNRDRFNAGVIGQWYLPAFNDSQWGTENTFYTWDQQDKPEDDQGHDYDGFGWYRGTIDVPADFKSKPVHFWSGGAVNEAWVWVNGEYAGHKPHAIWWMHPHDFDLDVSSLIKPGRNTITIRIWNDAEIGGLYRRGFFWSPKS